MSGDLQASFDTTLGCMVIHDKSGDIKLIVPNGKTKITSTGRECPACNRRDSIFAGLVADLLNTPSAPPKRGGCNGAAQQGDSHDR